MGSAVCSVALQSTPLPSERLPSLDSANQLPPNDSPEEHMNPLLSFLGSLMVEFGEDQSVAEYIDHEIWSTNEWIEDNQLNRLDSSPRQLGNIESTSGSESTRSIFDDLDADEKKETN